MAKNQLYFDDLQVGQQMKSGTLSVDTQAIKFFAAQFDPQPFHLDEEAGKRSMFKGLVASGWHTAALTMALIVKTNPPMADGTIGLGCEISWTQAVRPNDTLHIESEVLALKASESRPDHGLVTIRSKTFNQDNQVVQILTSKLIVPKRPQHQPIEEV